jgi:hypothetical protein
VTRARPGIKARKGTLARPAHRVPKGHRGRLVPLVLRVSKAYKAPPAPREPKVPPVTKVPSVTKGQMATQARSVQRGHRDQPEIKASPGIKDRGERRAQGVSKASRDR